MRLAIDMDYVTVEPQVGWYEWDTTWWKEDPWTWLHFPPVEGALEGLRALHDEGHDIVFATARGEHAVNEQWLHDHLGSTHWWSLIEGCKNKWEVDADLWLDDSPIVLEGVWKRGLCVVKFCTKHNGASPCSYAAHGWQHFLQLMEMGLDTRRKRRQRTDPRAREQAVVGDRWVSRAS